MKQVVQRVVTIALALLLVGVPAVTLAQTSTSPTAPSPGAQDKPTDKPTDKPSTPSASPPTSGPSDSGAKSGTGSDGQASPAAPASADACKNDGWQSLGFKTEAECTSKVKK